jgi:15-cis-phytoene synthase / lycopene beta-cyclase
MRTDYALVYAAIGRHHDLLRYPSYNMPRHLYYTISPAILLSAVYCPLSTVLDWYKVGFLLLVRGRHPSTRTAVTNYHQIAVVSTILWDSYLVRNRIWTYPPEAVLGPTLFQIPMEEVFFFVIQTYNTSILYLFLNKPTFFPTYLRAADGSSTVKDCFKIYRLIGQCFLAFLVAFGGYQVLRGGRGTHLGLILIWAVPFLFLLWYGSKPRYETG